MFTGIIEHKAKILSVQDWVFRVENLFNENINIWQSIAHDGACMTVNEIHDRSYSFFMMQESLEKTNFWKKNMWDTFNIERCLKIGDRIDGHFVSWHIDTTGEISMREQLSDNSLLLWVRFNKEFSLYTIEKWSITINGVSLTVVDTQPWYLSVSLIPLTQDWTNLWTIELWDKVNLEFDMLGKYILKQKWNV